MNYRQAVLILLVSFLASALPLHSARAADDAAASKEGIALYKEGRRLLSQHKYEEALEALDKSMAVLPSPNTGLLRAQALGELDRLGEAMEAYEQVMADAAARIGAGERRYQKTLEEAGRNSAALRAKVGELSVTVTRAPEGTTVSVGDRQVQAERVGARLLGKVWLAAGSATVEARSPAGTSVSDSVEIAAGSSANLELELPEAAPDPAPVEPLTPDPDEADDGAPFPWPPLPAIIAGGVGVVGFALFAGFGAASASTASDLDKCAPACSRSLQEDADSGGRNQTIANVGLVVGITGVAAFGTIWLVSELMDGEDAASDEVALGIGPGSLTVVGRF